MTQAELTNAFKYIVKKCDMLINNDDYEADAHTQDTVEDIAELCNHILDGDYGKLVELKEVDLDFTNEVDVWVRDNGDTNGFFNVQDLAKHFFELGLKAQHSELTLEDISVLRKIMAEYRRQTSNEMLVLNDEDYCKEVLNRFKAQKGK